MFATAINRAVPIVVLLGRPGLATDTTPGPAVDRDDTLHGRIRVAEDFRRWVGSELVPGATVVVTGDSLGAGTTGQDLNLIESDEEPVRR